MTNLLFLISFSILKWALYSLYVYAKNDTTFSTANTILIDKLTGRDQEHKITPLGVESQSKDIFCHPKSMKFKTNWIMWKSDISFCLYFLMIKTQAVR